MDSIDDKEDMQFADEAYDILGFSKEEKYNVYKVSSETLFFSFSFLRNFNIFKIQNPKINISQNFFFENRIEISRDFLWN